MLQVHINMHEGTSGVRRSPKTGRTGRENMVRSSYDRGTTHAELSHEALRLWLAWNKEYEEIMSRLFESTNGPDQVKDRLDHLDQLRWRAADLAAELLGQDGLQ